MSMPMQIELDEREAQQIRTLAVALHRTPQQTADAVVANGMSMLRRYAFLKAQSQTADVQAALNILKGMGRNNAPDPGDEMPADVEPVYAERRA